MKKRYKFLTVVFIVVILVSVLGSQCFAYVYEGNNGEYYIPDRLQLESPIVEKSLINAPSVSGSNDYFSYSKVGNGEFTIYNSDRFIMNNELTIDEHLEEYYSLEANVICTSLFDFEDYDNPLLFRFCLCLSLAPEMIGNNFNIQLNAIYQSSEQLESDSYNNAFNVVELSQLFIDGYDFVNTPASELTNGYTVYYISVDALCDPSSDTCFFTFYDVNGKSISSSCPLPGTDYLGFDFKLTDEVQSGNWCYFGFFGRSRSESKYNGFSCYELDPLASHIDLVPDVDQRITLDGSSYTGMTPVSTNYTGFENSDYYPLIEDGYYKIKSTLDGSRQFQLWFPYKNTGFSDFNSANNSTGSISFSLNCLTDEFLELKFVEGICDTRWSPEWCLTESFFKVNVPEVIDDATVVDVIGWDGLLLKQFVLESDSSLTGWFDVRIDIELNSLSDLIVLHYYIDGDYVGSRSSELTTLNNSITSVYFNLRSSTAGSTVLFDNFDFYYTNSFDYLEQYNAYCKSYIDKISDNESMYLYADYDETRETLYYAFEEISSLETENVTLKNDNMDLESELSSLNSEYSALFQLYLEDGEQIRSLKNELEEANLKIFDYKNNADFSDLFSGISEGMLIFVRGVSSLGYTIPGGISITIGGLITVAVLGAFLTFILKKILGRD